MTTRKVWDLEAKGGPAEVVMSSVNAREAVERDPKRYSFEEPDSRPAKAVVEEPSKPPKHSKKGKHDDE